MIEFRNITKHYGMTKANEAVTFSAKTGLIHAIVGENGAGKSTIMKILFGMEKPDSGEIFFAEKKGARPTIGMVHQHFLLAGPLTALDHVILESKKLKNLWSLLPREQILNELKTLSKNLNLPVPWTESIDHLTIGIQQRVEILKILYNQSEILILDEPTAILTPQEIIDFLNQLKVIRDQGKTIFLITHKLKEVFLCADEVTVFRKGKVVASRPLDQWTLTSLSEAMIGQSLQSFEVKSRPAQFFKQKILTIENLFDHLSFDIEKGEIVGVAGVEGNGQSELIQSLIQPTKLNLGKSANIDLDGISITNSSTEKIRLMGVGYLPEDRHTQALSLDSSLLDNFLLGHIKHFQKYGFIQFSAVSSALKKAIHEFDIAVGSEQQPVKDLSGGNQQKLVVSRELSVSLKLLIAAQPTRGVDILAIQKIHQELINARCRGTGVLLISSELDELMKLSDRILVIYRKKVIAEFSRSQFDEKKIGAAMGGISQ